MDETSSDRKYLLWLYDRVSNDRSLKDPNGTWRFDPERLKEIADKLPEGDTSVQMTSFETEVKKAAEKAVLKIISDGQWIAPDYGSRFRVPQEWVQKCWEIIDKDKLQERFARRLEEELANRMVNLMATEIATDVKQILSDKERRESLRALARNHMEAIMGVKQEEK